MIDKIFLDSNLWIYLYAKNPPEKFQQVVEIIKNNSSSLLVSTQVLGELFHVLTRKKFTSKTDAITIISDIVNTFPIQAINTTEVIQALEINAKYNYSYWDSLIIADASLVILAEDLGHGRIFSVDQRDFNTYRWKQNYPFENLLF